MAIITRSGKGAPLSAADHDNNLFSLISGYRNVLQNAAPTDGTTDARTALAAADAAAVTASVDLFFPAGTYLVSSNLTINSFCRFAKGAKLKPANGVTITLVEGYEARDWQHVFDISAGGKIEGHKMSGYLTPQHFGAKADAVNNDSPAIMAACNYASLQTSGHASFKVFLPTPTLGSHWYRLEQTIYVARCIQLEGETPIQGRYTAAVYIRPVNGLMAAIVFMGSAGNAVTVPGVGDCMAAGSKVTNLGVRPISDGGVRYGIVNTCPVFFEACSANYFQYAGFASIGQTGGSTTLDNLFLPVGSSSPANSFARLYDGRAPFAGDASGSSFKNCRASQQTMGHGFYCAGNGGMAIEYTNCDATGNQGAGYCDNSFGGSHYLFNHSAQNTWKVWNPVTSTMYMCIKGHQASADKKPGEGANWRIYWTVSGSSVKDEDYNASKFYPPCGAINVCSKTDGYANILGHYSEGGIEEGVIPRSKTTILGGVAVSSSRVVYHPEFEGALVLQQGGRFMNSFGRIGVNDPWGAATEAGFWVGDTNPATSYESDRIYSFGDSRDDAVNKVTAVRLSWNDTTKSYGWVRGTNMGTPIFGFTGTGFNRGGYTDVGAPVAPVGLLLGNSGTNFPNLVKLNAVNASSLAGATTALSGQAAVRGQRWYYNQTSAGGKEGVVCTTAGTVGSGAVLKEFGSIAA